ncbi:MAG: hypothetical protein ACLQU4_12495 [Limisphaerales bacterium]
MPNWCDNQLEVRGPSNDVKRFKKKAVGYYPWATPGEKQNGPADPLNFHNLVPIPKKVLKAENEDAVEDWARENWDTKWGAYESKMGFVLSQDPLTVWTILEDNNGEWYLRSGCHWVNRIGYLISTKPFEADQIIRVYPQWIHITARVGGVHGPGTG